MHRFTRKKCYDIMIRECNYTVFSDCINEFERRISRAAAFIE